MPTYEYLCQACSHRFETWQKMSDEPLTICPECGGSIRRVLYAAGVVFKGHGFYKTDYNGHNATTANGNGNHSNNETNGTNGDSKAENSSKTSENTTASSTESKSTSGSTSSTTESKPAASSNKTATSASTK